MRIPIKSDDHRVKYGSKLNTKRPCVSYIIFFKLLFPELRIYSEINQKFDNTDIIQNALQATISRDRQPAFERVRFTDVAKYWSSTFDF